MIRRSLLLMSLSATGLAGQAPPRETRTLLPVPAVVRFNSGRVVLDTGFRTALTGFRDDRLQRGVERALRRLEGRTGLTFIRPLVEPTRQPTLIVKVDGAGMAVQGIDEDESYGLDVGAGRITLHAGTVVGALRGLETLLQLVEGSAGGFSVPAVHIEDAPRFRWRGLLIDVARHWEPPEVIKRTLDAMASVKLNVLHWHLSDDQGFRVESRRYPRLQQRGSDGLYYTQAQIREIVAYARDRGIRVVPEFDMPGHSVSWLVGYPQYAAAPGPFEIERSFGVFDPVFDPTREEVYRFIAGFIGEMVPLFPDAYWHVGGDEVDGKEWNANPRIAQFRKTHHLKDNEALQVYFNRRLQRILAKYHRKMVGWDEILQPDLPKDVVVQSWRGQESLGAGARQGFFGILSAGYYLDAMMTAGAHYAVDPLPPGNDLSDAEAARILGGEACAWAELLTPEIIDSRLWPRTAAIAERFWSPREVTDTVDLYRRLAVTSTRLEEFGLDHQGHAPRMLRRMAAGGDISALKQLAGIVEPLGLGGRVNWRRPTQFTPLTGLPESVDPDPRRAHDISAMIDRLLADAPSYRAGRDSLARLFAGWRDLQPLIEAEAARAPMLRDAVPVAAAAAATGTAGLQALQYLGTESKPPAGWKDAQRATLDGIYNTPVSAVRVAVVPAVRRLLEAVRE